MQRDRFSPDDRAISPVIGTVLLVALVTVAMAVVAAAILGGGPFEPEPKATLIYQESVDDTVDVAVVDVRGLSADDTEIQPAGGGSCGYWDGHGPIEKGNVTSFDRNNCTEPLDDGDTIQVVGSDTLIDTYELRGVSPEFDICEEAIEDGELELTTGEVLRCDLVAEDGGRVDVDFRLRGGTLIGEVNLSEHGNLDLEGGTVDGNVESERFRIETDWTIDGDLTVPASANEAELTLKSRTEVGGSIRSDESSIEVEPEVDVGENVYIFDPDEELNVKRDGTIGGEVDIDESTARLERETTVGGPVTAGEVDLGEDARIEDRVDVSGPVSLDRGARIEDDVSADEVTFDGDATIEGDVSGGDITMEPDATIRGTADGDEIQLKDRATIDGDVAGDEIDLRVDATIEGDVTGGDVVNCGSGAEIAGDPCDEHDNYTGS